MPRRQKFVLILSAMVLLAEICALIVFHAPVVDWVSHNLWVVLLPFAKKLFKALFGFKLVAFLKSLLLLGWHLAKLLLLKILKTLGLRYGVFFTQYRWYWVRRSKVMFVRRGKQFFRYVGNFWALYSREQRLIILVAFFPVGIILFFLGLSFNVTRKTMVQKTQESAIFKVAATAGSKSSGLRAWIARLDQMTLRKIQIIINKDKIKKRPSSSD